MSDDLDNVLIDDAMRWRAGLPAGPDAARYFARLSPRRAEHRVGQRPGPDSDRRVAAELVRRRPGRHCAPRICRPRLIR